MKSRQEAGLAPFLSASNANVDPFSLYGLRYVPVESVVFKQCRLRAAEAFRWIKTGGTLSKQRNSVRLIDEPQDESARRFVRLPLPPLPGRSYQVWNIYVLPLILSRLLL